MRRERANLTIITFIIITIIIIIIRILLFYRSNVWLGAGGVFNQSQIPEIPNLTSLSQKPEPEP